MKIMKFVYDVKYNEIEKQKKWYPKSAKAAIVHSHQ